MGFSFRVRGGSRALVSLLLMGAATFSFAQPAKMMLAEPPAPLLPQSLRIGDLHVAGEGAPPDSGADGPVLIEAGLRRYERGAPAGTANVGTVTVYQFDDATGAYSAYTYLRKSGGEHVMLSGVSVVVSGLTLSPPASQVLFKTIQTGLPKVGGPKGLPPLLPTFLPEKGLEKDTLKYALGPKGYQAMGGILPAEIIGFDKAAEVVTAKYQGRGTLTLLLYPTPQIAGDHGRQVEAEMNREGRAAGTVKLRREGPLVLLTTGAWSPEEAKAMVENIHLHDELTWNKAVPLEFHSEIRKTVSLLTSIAAFCGLGALAAVVLALFFGGGRAMIRVLQGKPAASEPEFLRIDLSGRISSIHSESSGAERKT